MGGPGRHGRSRRPSRPRHPARFFAPRRVEEQAASEAIAAPVEEAARTVREQPVVHADETGWYERSKRAWLWVAMTAPLMLFLVRAHRGAKLAKELLGATFAGILISDRWSA